jgi:hypothetical protein
MVQGVGFGGRVLDCGLRISDLQSHSTERMAHSVKRAGRRQLTAGSKQYSYPLFVIRYTDNLSLLAALKPSTISMSSTI